MAARRLKSFPIPNRFFEIAQRLTKSEILLYLYILKHSGNSEDGSAAMTYSEMELGVRNDKGERLDCGTGLAVSSIKSAITSLQNKQLIVVQKEGTNFERRYSYEVYFPNKNEMQQIQVKTCHAEFSPAENRGADFSATPNLAQPGAENRPAEICRANFGFLSLGKMPSKEGINSPYREPSAFGLQAPTTGASFFNLNRNDTTTDNNNTAGKDKYTAAVQILWNAVGRINKQDPRSSQKSWHLIFEKYNRNFDYDRFIKVLRWYCDNIEQAFDLRIPEAYSAKTFCDKFMRIESAMQRTKVDAQRQQQKQEEEDYVTPESLPEHTSKLTAEEQKRLDALETKALYDLI